MLMSGLGCPLSAVCTWPVQLGSSSAAEPPMASSAAIATVFPKALTSPARPRLSGCAMGHEPAIHHTSSPSASERAWRHCPCPLQSSTFCRHPSCFLGASFELPSQITASVAQPVVVCEVVHTAQYSSVISTLTGARCTVQSVCFFGRVLLFLKHSPCQLCRNLEASQSLQELLSLRSSSFTSVRPFSTIHTLDSQLLKPDHTEPKPIVQRSRACAQIVYGTVRSDQGGNPKPRKASLFLVYRFHWILLSSLSALEIVNENLIRLASRFLRAHVLYLILIVVLYRFFNPQRNSDPCPVSSSVLSCNSNFKQTRRPTFLNTSSESDPRTGKLSTRFHDNPSSMFGLDFRRGSKSKNKSSKFLHNSHETTSLPNTTPPSHSSSQTHKSRFMANFSLKTQRSATSVKSITSLPLPTSPRSFSPTSVSSHQTSTALRLSPIPKNIPLYVEPAPSSSNSHKLASSSTMPFEKKLNPGIYRHGTQRVLPSLPPAQRHRKNYPSLASTNLVSSSISPIQSGRRSLSSTHLSDYPSLPSSRHPSPAPTGDANRPSSALNNHNKQSFSSSNPYNKKLPQSSNHLYNHISITPELPLTDWTKLLDITPRLVTKVSRNKFEAHLPSDPHEISKARECLVVNESGQKVKFGELIGGTELKGPRLVVFIRQFGHSYCQKYLRELEIKLGRVLINPNSMKLVVIGNGSHGMIRKFKEITATRFEVYSDETNRKELYHALGMTLRTLDTFPINPAPPTGLGIRGNAEFSKHQLGGEFVFEAVSRHQKSDMAPELRQPLRPEQQATVYSSTPSLSDSSSESSKSLDFDERCTIQMTYAHRMRNIHDHAPIDDLLFAAGL
ncbi:hypothetical protein O181_024437 [Austropuccinia psidii MF-1]|uniref:Uncharacterized protein n=1 Tax=Austropuccinia psidii MF-1 TaxID=1389203 RepID=A0A9Q3GYZ5_9BASI|nr:hypothetical protein [Austropuccinia psidii MF-1]